MTCQFSNLFTHSFVRSYYSVNYHLLSGDMRCAWYLPDSKTLALKEYTDQAIKELCFYDTVAEEICMYIK